MPNYHPNAKSLVYGLSDFWTLYFRELPMIEEIYRGVEVDVGQVYLDLLSLLLTTSVQDTNIFNKQYFQLVRIREDGITYSSDGLYGAALDQDLADLKYLNNRVFGVTAALEKNVDFTFDEATRSALFAYDPLSAYRARTFGAGNASFTLTSRVTDPVASQLRFYSEDNGDQPPIIFRNGYTFVISYTLGVTTAAEIVAAINAHPELGELVVATLPGATTGSDSPNTFGITGLQRQAVAPLQGYAVRTFDVLFGTKFMDASVPRWLDLDVQKGDVLRIIDAPDYGPPQEFPIALVKEDRLVLYPQVAPADISGGIDYAILRSPANDLVKDEPFVNTAALSLVFDTDTTIIGATRTLLFNSPLFLLPNVFVGSKAILSSAVNAGEYTIVEVIDTPYSWVVDGNPLVDELNATTTVSSVLVNLGFNGEVTQTTPTTATFFSPFSGWPSNTAGGVLSLDLNGDGNITKYDVLEVVDPDTLTIAATGLPTLTGLDWGIALSDRVDNAVVYAPPVGWLVPGSVQINARRWLDGAAVQEGRDYIVNVDTGIIQTLTVWEPSERNRIDYRYRLSQHNTLQGAYVTSSGTLSIVGDTPRFNAPFYSFTAAHIGNVLEISGAFVVGNNGRYQITGVLSPTLVTLASTHMPALPDGNNGTLTALLYPRGSAVVTDVIEPVVELGMWAPDAEVDKYHLYFTYGYLIDRIQRSSEAYRALIRGLFQLFMLGPTLERFESAINIVAALPVIRDDGEIFLDYESGAMRSGTDGVFDAFSRTFTSASAAFVPADLSNRLYVKTGYNANKIFNIASVVDATTVVLAETPTSDTAVSWEITATAEHAIVTSRDRYVYPRNAPLKPKFLNPANEGVMVLRAFEVVTAAFEVTDYVETPTWWENARIPQTLLPDYTPQRRQSTPAMFENILNPGDGGSVGDPGYFVGADDEGDVIPTVVLYSGSSGALFGDPLYPSRETEVFFSDPFANFTAKDVGNYIRAFDRDFLIVGIVTPGRVKIVSHIPYPFTGTATDNWQLIAGTIPLRHTAAYMILDRLLKYHLFTVRFDAYLLEQLPANVIRDLQELVFVAKPTYTYLLLTPNLLFEELIRITEDSIDVHSTLNPGGQGGELVLGNTNPLVIGPAWTVGSWYRYVENTSTFSAPLNPLMPTLGAPPAGYQRRPHKVYIEPADFVSVTSGRPRGYDELIYVTTPINGTQGQLYQDAGEWVFELDPAFGVPETSVLTYIRISAPSVNAGVYRIGRVRSLHTVIIDAVGLTPETGIFWEVLVTGSQAGRISFTAEGESFFEDLTGDFFFPVGSPGTYVRRIYISTAGQDSYRIDEVTGPTEVRLAEYGRMVPEGTVLTANVLSINVVEVPDMYFNDAMTYYDRSANDFSTGMQRQYFLDFTAGLNAGTRVRLMRYITPTTVEVDGPLFVESGASVEPSYRQHYTGTQEDGAWENYQHTMYVDNESAVTDMMVLPTDVAATTVNYTSYGVQEPTFPLTATFDDTVGDTYYAIGGILPVPRFMRSRTALDVDLIEMPVQISRSASPFPLVVIDGDYVSFSGLRLSLG